MVCRCACYLNSADGLDPKPAGQLAEILLCRSPRPSGAALVGRATPELTDTRKRSACAPEAAHPSSKCLAGEEMSHQINKSSTDIPVFEELRRILSDLDSAICVVDVTRHSLEHPEIGGCEATTLYVAITLLTDCFDRFQAVARRLESGA